MVSTMTKPTCNGELGRAGTVDTGFEGLPDPELCPGCAVCHKDCVGCKSSGWVPVRGVYPSTIDCDTEPDPCPTYRPKEPTDDNS